jgi:hypothetical protein
MDIVERLDIAESSILLLLPGHLVAGKLDIVEWLKLLSVLAEYC